MRTMMKNKRKNILDLFVVIVWINFYVLVKCKKCESPVRVVSCPKDTYTWSQHAKDFCVNTEEYHCLLTEDGYLIECCMTPEMISKGHFPRFNILKNTLQEIPCDDDHYMPTEYSSNKWLDNGPTKCKYQKHMCNGLGMKMCTNGSPTEDRTCKCNYMQGYEPEILIETPCFLLSDNRCYPNTKCTGQNVELNMKYECVEICSPGYYRPEGEMECKALADSTISSTMPTTQQVLNISTTNASNMEMDHSWADRQMGLIVAVIILIFVLIVLVLCCIRKPCNGNIKDFCCISKIFNIHVSGGVQIGTGNKQTTGVQAELDPLLNITADQLSYEPLVGSTLNITVSVECLVGNEDEIKWFYAKGEIKESSKYIIGDVTQPKLTIQDITVKDSGVYFCKVGYVKSENIEVKVKEPVLKLPTTNYTVERGISVTINAEISNIPGEFEVHWKKKLTLKDIDIDLDVKNRTDKYEDAAAEFPHLTIKNVCKDDEGLYSCWITYQIGSESFMVPDPLKENMAGENMARVHVVERSSPVHTYIQNIGNVEKQNVVYVKENEQMNIGEKCTVIKGSFKQETKFNETGDSNADESSTSSGEDHENDEENDNNKMCHSEGGGINGHLAPLNHEVTAFNENPHKTRINEVHPTENIMNGLSEIGCLAAYFGCTVENVDGDGNCLFNAVSKQMPDYLPNRTLKEKAYRLRQDVVTFLRKNDKSPEGDMYSSFLRKDDENNHRVQWAEYLDEMGKSGTYGDEIIIKAIAHCFKVQIWVLSTERPEGFLKYSESQSGNIIRLGYLRCSKHFVVLNISGNMCISLGATSTVSDV